jgi:hypothetical protein
MINIKIINNRFSLSYVFIFIFLLSYFANSQFQDCNKLVSEWIEDPQ